MKKRILSVLLCLSIAVGMFAGCGSDSSDNSSNVSTTDKSDNKSDSSDNSSNVSTNDKSDDKADVEETFITKFDGMNALITMENFTGGALYRSYDGTIMGYSDDVMNYFEDNFIDVGNPTSVADSFLGYDCFYSKGDKPLCPEYFSSDFGYRIMICFKDITEYSEGMKTVYNWLRDASIEQEDISNYYYEESSKTIFTFTDAYIFEDSDNEKYVVVPSIVDSNITHTWIPSIIMNNIYDNNYYSNVIWMNIMSYDEFSRHNTGREDSGFLEKLDCK